MESALVATAKHGSKCFNHVVRWARVSITTILRFAFFFLTYLSLFISSFVNVISLEDPASFSNYTRIKENVLNDLLLLIAPHIQKQNTVMREAISPRDRFSATLRYLATGNTFQDLAYSTRIASNTLSQIVHETVEAIIRVLEEKVMVFPSTVEEWKFIADKYQTNWQFPHCIGALDGKHIVFQPPRKWDQFIVITRERTALFFLLLLMPNINLFLWTLAGMGECMTQLYLETVLWG